jgi:hypothetical protein
VTDRTTPEPDSQNEGYAEPPTDEELNSPLLVRPDPRQPAYDAVYEYIRGLGDYLPPDRVHRNAIIWRAVQRALDATHVGRCVSSHCVEGDHVVFVEDQPDSPATRATEPGESPLPRDRALERVEALAYRWETALPADLPYARSLRAALAGPSEPS